MNALIAPQSMKRAPFIGHTPRGVPVGIAVDILNEGSQSGHGPSVVLLDDAQRLLPVQSQYDWRFGVVWLTELQLRALAGLVSVVPRFAQFPELVQAPKLRGVMNITDDMCSTAVTRSRARAPGYMVVLKELSPARRKEARQVARHFNLVEEGLSLTSAMTVAVLSSVVLKQPWRQMYSTSTYSSDGRHLAVGPGSDGRVTIGQVWPNECYPALEFIREQ